MSDILKRLREAPEELRRRPMPLTDEQLSAAESKCLGAVSHVGLANYADRENEAYKWVREAFAGLRAQIEEAHTACRLLVEDLDAEIERLRAEVALLQRREQAFKDRIDRQKAASRKLQERHATRVEKLTNANRRLMAINDELAEGKP